MKRGWLISLFCISVLSVIWMMSVPASARKSKPTEVRDAVTVQADALALPGVPGEKIDLTLQNEVKWSDIYTNWNLGNLQNLPACVTPTADKDQAYIFHIVHWKIGDDKKPPQLVSSSWSAYGSRHAKDPDAMKRRLDSSGNPLIYGKKKVLVIGINVFDNAKNGASTLTIRYKSSVTQGTPENVQALGQLVTSLAGLASAAKAAQGSILIAFACQQGTAHLPFDVNVVETIGLPKASGDDGSKQQPTPGSATPQTQPDPKEKPSGNSPPGSTSSGRSDQPASPRVSNVQLRLESTPAKGVFGEYDPAASLAKTAKVRSNSDATGRTGDDRQQDTAGSSQDNSNNSSQKKSGSQTPQSGQADCSGLSDKNSCSISRTLTSLDKEWWDVSLAQTVVGVKESKYSISGTSLVSKPTTHNDFYAFFDIYPWAYWVTKDSGIPHVIAGLPVTGQTFYRPAFGLSENVTGWTHLEKLGFPVKMSLFFALVDMKITRVTGAPTTTSQLSADSTTGRVLKPIYGIEVPVSALISKIGKGNSSKSTNAGTGTKGNAVNQGSSATQ